MTEKDVIMIGDSGLVLLFRTMHAQLAGEMDSLENDVKINQLFATIGNPMPYNDRNMTPKN